MSIQLFEAPRTLFFTTLFGAALYPALASGEARVEDIGSLSSAMKTYQDDIDNKGLFYFVREDTTLRPRYIVTSDDSCQGGAKQNPRILLSNRKNSIWVTVRYRDDANDPNTGTIEALRDRSGNKNALPNPPTRKKKPTWLAWISGKQVSGLQDGLDAAKSSTFKGQNRPFSNTSCVDCHGSNPRATYTPKDLNTAYPLVRLISIKQGNNILPFSDAALQNLVSSVSSGVSGTMGLASTSQPILSPPLPGLAMMTSSGWPYVPSLQGDAEFECSVPDQSELMGEADQDDEDYLGNPDLDIFDTACE